MLRVYDAMLPAERTVGALGLLLPRAPEQLKSRLMRDFLSAADVPGSLGRALHQSARWPRSRTRGTRGPTGGR